MNTTPIIFNERKVPHTIIGGQVRKTDEEVSPVTVILLNRGGRYYRSAVLQNLENAGFDSVISIELSAESYDIESLSQRFPRVKFLIPLEKLTVGEMINTGMAETASPRVLVIWNDIRISANSIGKKVLERVKQDDLLCLAPQLSGPKMEALPVQMVPALMRKQFLVEPMAVLRDGCPTVYPFDFTGIYNRERFIRMGGFDWTIADSYWQNLDFGFRAHLWGEHIQLSSSFRLGYDGESAVEDTTRNVSYMRFYLKNLAPVFRRDQAVLPYRLVPGWLTQSGLNPVDALTLFKSVRRWVYSNRYRFTTDAASLCAAWEPVLQ